MAVKLFLNENEIAVGGTTIPINKQIVDFNSFSEIKSDFSKSFDILLTDENRHALECLDVFTSLSRLPYVKIPAKVLSDGIEVIKNGVAIIEASTKKKVKCTIYSGNKSWSSQLESLKLADVDYSDSVHFWNSDNIKASHETKLPYHYALVDYGNGGVTDAEYIRPWVYVADLMNRIFSNIGYTIEGELLNDVRYQNEIIECSQNKYDTTLLLGEANTNGDLTLIWNDAIGKESWIHFPVIANDPYAPFETPGLFENTTTIVGDKTFYHVKKSGVYHFDLRMILQPVSINFPNGANVFPPQQVAWEVVTFPQLQVQTVFAGITNQNIQTKDISFSMALTEGDIVSFLIRPKVVPTGTFNRAWSIKLKNGSSFAVSSVDVNDESVYGDLIGLSGLLPDMKQTEFVKAIAFKFGQAIIPDNDGKLVTFRSWNELKDRKGEAVDWSAKIDDLQDSETKYRLTSWAQKNWLRSTADDSVPSGYGDGYIGIADEWLTLERNVFQLPFCATSNNANGEPLIPRLEANKWKNEVGSRLLMTTEVAGTKTMFYPDGSMTMSPYRKAFFKDAANVLNIGFDDRLIDDYFAFVDTFVDGTKAITVSMLLDAEDINTLDPFLPVYIQRYGSYFFVNRVNSWIANKPCKVELIRI